MSGDPEQEYFSDGISDDIITDLSKVAGLTVIARNSSFAYKGRAVDVRTIGRELAVRSVLEGSIRRAGQRVRITAQLIDAASGAHVWAERYDRDLTDIFAVQDDVTHRIVEALKVTLSAAENARLTDGEKVNVDAYDCILRGRELLAAPAGLGRAKNREILEQSSNYFRRALEIDPSYSQAYAGLSMAYNLDYQIGGVMILIARCRLPCGTRNKRSKRIRKSRLRDWSRRGPQSSKKILLKPSPKHRPH